LIISSSVYSKPVACQAAHEVVKEIEKALPFGRKRLVIDEHSLGKFRAAVFSSEFMNYRNCLFFCEKLPIEMSPAQIGVVAAFIGCVDLVSLVAHEDSYPSCILRRKVVATVEGSVFVFHSFAPIWEDICYVKIHVDNNLLALLFAGEWHPMAAVRANPCIPSSVVADCEALHVFPDEFRKAVIRLQ